MNATLATRNFLRATTAAADPYYYSVATTGPDFVGTIVDAVEALCESGCVIGVSAFSVIGVVVVTSGIATLAYTIRKRKKRKNRA